MSESDNILNQALQTEEISGNPDKSNSAEKTKKELENSNSIEKQVDAEVTVERSSDNLRALLRIFPPVGKGRHVTADMIHKGLEKHKITFGIDQNAIDSAVKNQEYMKLVQVAIGKKPVDGKNSQLIYHYKNKAKTQDKSIENLGQIDYKEQQKIFNIKSGELLLEKIPATEGTIGKSVTGKNIYPVKGKDFRIRAAKGVSVDSDRLKFSATTDGQVIFRNSQLKVDPVFRTEKVDSKTGNIHFVGSVIVQSMVEDGFTVEADGDIRIGGTVGASTVIATGNITIGNGILGDGQAKIISKKGNIYCKFIQAANVSAGKNIYIEEYCKNSVVKSFGKLEITSNNPKRGFIIGGKAYAVNEITCNNAGCDLEIPTELIVGVDGEAQEKMEKIKTGILANIPKCEKVAKMVLQLQKIRKNNGSFGSKRARLMQDMAKLLTNIRLDSSISIEEYFESLGKNRFEENSFIRVKSGCYPQVDISINGISHQNEKKETNLIYKMIDGVVVPKLKTT